MTSNTSRMEKVTTRFPVGKWPSLQEKENSRYVPNAHMGTVDFVNRDGCISEKHERPVLKECTNIQAGTIPTTRQHSKKPIILNKSKFRVTPGHRSAQRRNRKTRTQAKVVGEGSIPSYVVIKDEAMEVETIYELFTQLGPVRLPSGVRDADKHTKVFLCPEYACDIVNYLQEVEARWTFPATYLERDPELTPRMRAILMDWLTQVQNHENLNEESLHLTVAMIDRYASIQKVRLSLLQLLGITCLLIAAKFIERFPPEISTLCKLTANSYTVAEVLGMEIVVLKTLKFDLNIPTPITFLRRFIGTQSYTKEEYQLSEYVLDLSLTNHVLVYFPPSLIAASTLYLARLLFRTEMIWTPTLAFYTKYIKQDMKECIVILSKMLFKASSRELQGARTKFASSRRGAISKHEILKDNTDLINATKGILPSNR